MNAEIEKYQQMMLQRDSALRLFQQLHQDDEPEWHRAGGGVTCILCGLKYREHYSNDEWDDKRLCDGRVVHL